MYNVNLMAYDEHNKKKLDQEINKYFISLFNGSIHEDDFIHLLNETKFQFAYDHFCIFTINFASQTIFQNLFLSEKVTSDLQNFLSTIMVDAHFQVITLRKNLLCVLVNTNGDLNPILWNKVYQTITKYIGTIDDRIKVFLGYSKIYNEIKMIKKAYLESLDALYHRFISNENIFPYTYTASLRTIDDSSWEQLEYSLKLGLTNEAESKILSIFDQYKKNIKGSQIQFIVKQLINIFQYITLHNDLDRSLIPEKFSDTYFLFDFDNLSDVSSYMTEMCRHICDSISINSSHHLGKTIVEYIHSNYTKPINLNTIANTFHINSTYLGQLLKKEVNMPFNKYINKLRIIQAMKMIEYDSNVKLKDIAHSIGYSDSHYFSKIFKQVTGISPSEYKKKNSIY